MMEVITERMLIASAADRFAKRYSDEDEVAWIRDGKGGTKNIKAGKLIARLRKLDPLKATSEDVAKIIGNPTWTEIICTECDKKVTSAVQLFDQDDNVFTLCNACLHRAVDMEGKTHVCDCGKKMCSEQKAVAESTLVEKATGKRKFAPIDADKLVGIILATVREHADEYERNEITEMVDELNKKGKAPTIDNMLDMIMVGYRYVSEDAHVHDDLSKVQFDWENCNCKPFRPAVKHLLGPNETDFGMTFVGFQAGGDWESPVYFILYYDGKNLRAYIPTDGNPWNRTDRRAYGNDEESDNADVKKHFGADSPGEIDFDAKAIMADITRRFGGEQKKGGGK